MGQDFKLSWLRDGDDGLNFFAVGPEDGDRPHGVGLGDDEAAPAGPDVQLVIVHGHRRNLQTQSKLYVRIRTIREGETLTLSTSKVIICRQKA